MRSQHLKVEEVLQKWRALPQQSERLLLELCEGDGLLFQNIKGILDLEATKTFAFESPTRTSPSMALQFNQEISTCSESQIPTAPLPRLPSIPGYEIYGLLGRGGMGVVFRAKDIQLNREVALKVLTPAAAYNPDLHARFLRESQALARLDHPNIVPIFDAGEVDQLPFFTMKLIHGGTLASALTRIGQDVNHAVTVMIKVANAVQYLHDQGILHRDLKPGNILLSAIDEPMVADFGLAKWITEDSDLTASGLRMGTRWYMAPEQASGQVHETGQASDIWALGVILYEMLSGKRPFYHSDPLMLEQMIRTTEPPNLALIKPRISTILIAIVSKCLSKNPANRYSSARELANDLSRWHSGKQVHIKRAFQFQNTGRRSAIALSIVLLIGALFLVAHSNLSSRSSGLDANPVISNPTPESKRSLSDRVQANEIVSLEPAKLEPDEHHIITDWRGSVRDDNNGVFIVTGTNFLSFELNSEALPPQFELEAEIAPETNSPQSSEFGVYAGRKRWSSPGLTVDRFVAAGVTGRQIDRDANGNRLVTTSGTMGIIWAEMKNKNLHAPPTPLAISTPILDPLPKNINDQKWYKVSLRIDNSNPPSARFQNELYFVKRPEVWDQILTVKKRHLLNPQSIERPILGAGMGIYVYGGVARFRNIIVKPLSGQ